MTKTVVALVTGLAMLSAPVKAACWTRDEASAAGLRELQSMLMVTALRCEASGRSMMTDYNGFVSANRATIAAENSRILQHFIHAQGAIAGQRAYDSFTTSMANGYGAGQGAPESCEGAIDLAREAGAMAGSRGGLMMLMDRLGLEARLPEGRCEPRPPITMASATGMPTPPYAAARIAAGYRQAAGALVAVNYRPEDDQPVGQGVASAAYGAGDEADPR